MIRRNYFTVFAFLTLMLLVCGGISSADMTVHFIDVKQGGGVFVQKDGLNILYDCGDTFAGPIVTQYLAALDVEKIDILIVSHAHQDHMGGCVNVLKTLPVDRVYHNGSKAKTGTWKEFLKEINKRVQEINVVEKDLDLTSGVQILVAYDSHGKFYSKEADNSVLVKLTDGKVRVLLTGDCEATCEKEVSAQSNVRSDVLNVGHHGSNASSSPAFLVRVKPQIAVIQAGAGNQYGHPTKPVLQRLKGAKAKIYRTDLDGAIVLTSDGQTFTVETDK
jgi:competence protein ComEC